MMQSFSELLADYLQKYGDYVRENGHDVEFRGVQRELYTLARIVRDENIQALQERIEELDEDIQYGLGE